MHTSEENFVGKIRSEVNNVMTTVETRVQDAVLIAIKNLLIPRMELAMKTANASSGRSGDGNVLEPNRRDFLGNVEGLQMTASSGKHSRTDFKMIEETHGIINVEGGDLLVYGKNIDQQTHTHHMVTEKNTPQEIPEFFSGQVPTYREPTQPRSVIR